jgi:hypothetical protein
MHTLSEWYCYQSHLQLKVSTIYATYTFIITKRCFNFRAYSSITFGEINQMNVWIHKNSRLASLAALRMNASRIAIVFGNTIHLHGTTKEEFLFNKKWVCHELTHVIQYQRYGFIRFIFLYLIESIKHGYRNNKFEIEARENETNFQLLDRFKFE